LGGLTLYTAGELRDKLAMRWLAPFGLLALCGCATSMSAIQTKPIQETVVSPRSIADIEHCIIASQPGGRTPFAQTVDGVRELTINQDAAGAVMFFAMRPVASGTEVTFRRKGALVNYDDQARACYSVDGGKQ